jgi:hypothetical protein
MPHGVLCALVAESGLGWGGQPQVHSEAPGDKCSRHSELWERYSGDKHI